MEEHCSTYFSGFTEHHVNDYQLTFFCFHISLSNVP
jgi:hypothetical protein